MPLTVLCSLALMLQLMSGLLHFVSLVTSAWVQVGVFVPVQTGPTPPTAARAGGRGAGNGSDPLPSPDSVEFVKVRLGLWEWCQQFQEVTPNCQTPGFLAGVEVLAVVASFTLPVAFILLLYTACLQLGTRKRRIVTIINLVISAVSGILLLVAVVMYAVLTRREVARMMSMIGKDPELSYLGWSYGAEVVASLLVCVSALFVCIHLRRYPKAPPQFQLVA
ncbi:uncharacterized protein [Littorina saxatilis]|uniref:Claudin n=1 Tax=Littorina saxatilis TaxID=31220 RepID=A0AAN9BX21_9CAEN